MKIPTTRRQFLAISGGAIAASVLPAIEMEAAEGEPDVCVYGGTASGIMAAVAAKREGARVLLIEPSRWLGGMTGGGLMHIDWGRREAVGGTVLGILSRDLNDPQYRQAFAALIKEHGIEVLFEHRLASAQLEGTKIRAIVLDHAPPDRFGCPIAQPRVANARTIKARVFIDCSYEGDLMAKAGVSYTWGRESRDEYGETLAGVRPNLALYDIDPYRKPGDASSGLLPLLQDVRLGPLGSADRLTMGYGFRWRFSKQADRLPIAAPEDYDPATYELYRRGFQKGIAMDQGRRMKAKLDAFESESGGIHKSGSGNLSRCLWAATVFGCNTEYPDGDWPTRARIWKFHQDFIRGITHFMRTDPAVPEKLKQEALSVGFQPGMFDETEGWPHQLYVREARRMKSSYVLTQKDLQGDTDPEDSVGLASYGVDDWPYATIAHEGKVALQGGEFSMLYLEDAHRGIYKIPYRALTPKAEECTNLLVPVCVSASHIAMTSIRMEPVWMILGESAGVASAMAVRQNTTVQQVNYAQLRSRLLDLQQLLERPV